MAIFNDIKSNNPVYKNMKSIFSDSTYKVPDFQRFYSWNAEQVNGLLDSIMELASKDKKDIENEKISNYLGNILLSKDKENRDLEIIDGQQRLTTFYIMLICLRDLLNGEKLNKLILNENKIVDFNSDSLKNGDTISKAKNRKNRIISEIDSCIYRNDYEKSEEIWEDQKKEPILCFSSLDDITQSKNILDYRPNKKNKNTWEKNYDLIFKSISDFVFSVDFNGEQEKIYMRTLKRIIEKINHLFECILENSYVLVNTIEDKTNAFPIFESLNSDGLDLTPFDLVNGWLHQQMNDRKINTEIKSKYKNKINDIKENNFKRYNKALKDYLFYYVNSYKNNTVSDKDLFREFKNIVKQKTDDGNEDFGSFIIDFVNDMDFIDNFLHTPSYNFYYLSWLKRKKVIPLLFLLKRYEYQEVRQDEIIGWLVRYSIMYLNLEDGSPGKFQYKIQKIMEYITKEYKNSGNNDIGILKIYEAIPEIKKDYNEYYKKLSSMLKRLSNKEIKDFDLIKTLLLMLFQNENNLVLLKSENIDGDHRIPTSYKKIKDDKEFEKLKTPKDWSDYIECIGNIILIDKLSNKEKSNSRIEPQNHNQNEAFKKLSWNVLPIEKEGILDKIDKRNLVLCDMLQKQDILWVEKTINPAWNEKALFDN